MDYLILFSVYPGMFQRYLWILIIYIGNYIVKVTGYFFENTSQRKKYNKNINDYLYGKKSSLVIQETYF